MKNIASIRKEKHLIPLHDYVERTMPEAWAKNHQILAALGYLELRIPELTVKLLGDVDGSILEDKESEHLRLLALEQAGLPIAVLARLARRSLERFPDSFRLLEMALIYLNGNMDFDQVIELYHEHCEQINRYGSLLQNVVSAAVGKGDLKWALRLLEASANADKESGGMMIDPQLTPLWVRYAAKELDLEEAEYLVGPGITTMLKQAEAGQVSGGLCAFMMEVLMPKRLKPWMELGFDAAYRPRADAPVQIKQQFENLRDGMRRSAIKMLRRARQNAWQCLARNGCKKKKEEEWEKGYWEENEDLDWEVLGDGGVIE